jgi:hypothetical protein
MTRSASTPASLDVKAAVIDGVITIVVIHDNTQLAELTLPAPSDEPQALLSTLTLEGINLCLYQSSIDDHVVLDVLTETPSPIQHDTDERPLLRITVNDDEVFDA